MRARAVISDHKQADVELKVSFFTSRGEHIENLTPILLAKFDTITDFTAVAVAKSQSPGDRCGAQPSKPDIGRRETRFGFFSRLSSHCAVIDCFHFFSKKCLFLLSHCIVFFLSSFFSPLSIQIFGTLFLAVKFRARDFLSKSFQFLPPAPLSLPYMLCFQLPIKIFDFLDKKNACT